jgi:hypothetical protein
MPVAYYITVYHAARLPMAFQCFVGSPCCLFILYQAEKLVPRANEEQVVAYPKAAKREILVDFLGIAIRHQ